MNTGLFGSKSSFVPLAGATPNGEDVRVAVDKARVKDAPGVEADGELSEEEEANLFRHYDVPYDESGSVTATGTPGGQAAGAPVGHDTSGPATDEAMTRSEEEVRVGTERRESGRVGLRKYVVTEHVTQTVPVQREEVCVEREPITEGNVGQATDGPAISEVEHEVVLHEERRSSRSASSPRSGCVWTRRPSPRSARSPKRFARSRSKRTPTPAEHGSKRADASRRSPVSNAPSPLDTPRRFAAP